MEKTLLSWVSFFASTNVNGFIEADPEALAGAVLAHVLSATLRGVPLQAKIEK